MEEFVELVATSAVLRPAFGDIMQTAKDKRDRDEFNRLSQLFRNPNELRAATSPSGRRRRPNLHDLRSVYDMTLPWSRTNVLSTDAYSPVKSPVKRRSLSPFKGRSLSPFKAKVTIAAPVE